MLETTLKKSSNSVVREKLFKHRFLYETQLAFMNRGSSILYYESDYDRDGFDLLFDNLINQRHIQMKSVLSSSKTTSFEIHRTFLRPRISELNNFPLSHDGSGAGYGGGVVLIEATVNGNELNFKYRYCDGVILTAFYAGYFSYGSLRKQESVIKAFSKFQNPNLIGGKVKLTKSCFIEFKNIISLFDYLGLGGYGETARYNLIRAIAVRYGYSNQSDKKVPFEGWKSILRSDFNKLIVWNDIQC